MTNSPNQQTLFHLIDTIKLKKHRLSRSRTSSTDEQDNSPKFWTMQEQQLFFNIMLVYGADYSILKHHFAGKSRKQIKKKCLQLQEKRKRALDRAEERRVQERRKEFFERDIMELDMIKWRNSKPNKPESSIESDSN